eukprot:4003616-Heterocapsa_arctica.AAC.2
MGQQARTTHRCRPAEGGDQHPPLRDSEAPSKVATRAASRCRGCRSAPPGAGAARESGPIMAQPHSLVGPRGV